MKSEVLNVMRNILQSPTHHPACALCSHKSSCAFPPWRFCPHGGHLFRNAEMQWSEGTTPGDLWKKVWEPDHFRAGKDPTGHFTDEETEVKWLAQGHTAIYQNARVSPGWSAWKEGTIGQPIRKKSVSNWPQACWQEIFLHSWEMRQKLSAQ